MYIELEVMDWEYEPYICTGACSSDVEIHFCSP